MADRVVLKIHNDKINSFKTLELEKNMSVVMIRPPTVFKGF